jgi:hypothetical protein
MKKFMTVLLASAIMMVAGGVYGQEVQKQDQSKAKKETTVKGKKVKEPKTQKKTDNCALKEAETPITDDGTGNAYGKNKGDVKGKDVGKTRSTTAKEKQKAKRDETKTKDK